MSDNIISKVLTRAMGVCRHDLDRQMSDYDYCLECLMLAKCCEDEAKFANSDGNEDLV